MNAPVEFTNPRNGHRYRLFQENFDGPYEPGSNEYTALVPPTATPDDLYASVLTVNYDPAAITEPALFETCLEEALAEVLALDPEARRATSPERAPAREARTTANAPPAPAASPESAS